MCLCMFDEFFFLLAKRISSMCVGALKRLTNTIRIMFEKKTTGMENKILPIHRLCMHNKAFHSIFHADFMHMLKHAYAFKPVNCVMVKCCIREQRRLETHREYDT